MYRNGRGTEAIYLHSVGHGKYGVECSQIRNIQWGIPHLHGFRRSAVYALYK
nr:MAG TPA: hypothetical protein [Caudoviricetes sp.]